MRFLLPLQPVGPMIRSICRIVMLATLWLGAAPVSAQHWVRTFFAAQTASPAAGDRDDIAPVPDLTGRTVRQVLEGSIGGDALRITLSNEFSPGPLLVGSAHVALAGRDGRIVAGSDRVVTFSGASSVTIPVGAPMVSDTVTLRVPPLARIAVSLYFPTGATLPTWHNLGAATSLIVDGNRTGVAVFDGAERWPHRLIVSAIDVERARRGRVIAATGDSITDGGAATHDIAARWPDRLARRVAAAGMTDVSVINDGLGGNRLLKERVGSYGVNLLARYDRDVLATPGLVTVLVLVGVNDLGWAVLDKAETPSADAIVAGYRQLIRRARARGARVVFGTITPYRGASYWAFEGEAVRAAVNHWVRTTREHDGFVDFDRAVRDPAAPDRLLKRYDSGDHLHLSDAGYAAIGDAVPLAMLED